MEHLRKGVVVVALFSLLLIFPIIGLSSSYQSVLAEEPLEKQASYHYKTDSTPQEVTALVPFQTALQNTDFYNSDQYEYIVEIPTDDTTLVESAPFQNFGQETTLRVGPGLSVRIKFDPGIYGRKGSLAPQLAYLALPFSDSAAYEAWLGYAASCGEWNEASATWANHNCLRQGYTTVPPVDSGWHFIQIPQCCYVGHSQFQLSDFYLFDAGTFNRTILSKESGPETAPRLIVVYPKDRQSPQIDDVEPAKNPAIGMNHLYIRTDFGISVRARDDWGISQIIYERMPASGSDWERGVMDMENGCRLTNAGTIGYLYSNGYPFPTMPLGIPYRYRIQAIDCAGNESDWVYLEGNAYLVESVEQVIFRTPDAVQLSETDPVWGTPNSIRRLEDAVRYPQLPAATGLGPNLYLGSISQTPDFLIQTRRGLIADPDMFSIHQDGSLLFITLPWTGSLSLISEPFTLNAGDRSVEFTVTIPPGERHFGSFMMSGTGGLNVDTIYPDGTVWQITYSAQGRWGVYSLPIYPWNVRPGDELTVRFDPPYTGNALTIDRLIVGAKRADLWVKAPTLVTSPQQMDQGISAAVSYGSYWLEPTQPVTLTTEVPNDLNLSNFSITPTAIMTDSGSVTYEWAGSSLDLTPEVRHQLTFDISGTALSGAAWHWAILVENDPNDEDNRSTGTLIVSDHLLYLPQIEQ